MDRSNVIYLISSVNSQDALGVWKKVNVKRKVYCQVESVSQSEWFEGGRNGLNPQYRMTMFRYDYNGEEVLEYDGTSYFIYRTYIGKNDTIELYVEKRKGTERA